MRVLFSSVGVIGHVYPMVPLARALLAAGHEVRWATSAEMTPTLAQAGIPSVVAGLSSAEWREPRNRRMRDLAHLPPDARTDQLVAWMFGETLAPAMLRDLLPVARSWRPAVVIHDTMEFAAPIAAGTVGALNVAHAYGPLTLEHRMRAIAGSVTPLWEAVDAEPRPYGGIYDHLYLDVYPSSLAQPAGTHVLRRQPVRPVSYAPLGGAPLDMLADDGRPLVYATIGTELPDQRLLQAIVEAISPLEVRVLATVGPRGDPEAFGARPENVAIARYVPQTAVLPHASVVISHGGSGTVLAAMAAGVPQVCLPQFADQPLNAAAVAGAGAGLVIEVNALEHDTIRESVIRLLAEDSFRSRARAVRNEIMDMPSPEALAALLPELVNGLWRVRGGEQVETGAHPSAAP